MSYTNVDDPSAHFQAEKYTSNGSAASVTNGGNSDLQPDIVWSKYLGGTASWEAWDSTRGVNSTLFLTASEAQDTAANRIVSFDSDGWSYGTNGNHQTSGDYISYQWKANGGTTSSNTNGTITSTVQANTTGGISIVKWTGGGSAGSVGHGLGQKPAWVIYKKYSGAQNWNVNHEGLNSAAGVYYLHVNFSESTDSGIVSSAPTATVLNIGANLASSGDSYIAYCFAEKAGFSKFGRAYGNGLARGLYVPCGFKPKFVYWRNTTRNGDGAGWIFDTERDPNNNSLYKRIRVDSSGAEATATDGGLVMEMRGNGFAVTDNTGESWNYSDDGYIYCAFAENPFVTSSGAPTTAI